MVRTQNTFFLLAISMTCVLHISVIRACPLCPAASKTLGEEIETMDVVVIARLIKPSTPAGSGSELTSARFEVKQVIKGAKVIEGTNVIEAVYFGESKKGDSCLVMGVGQPDIQWLPPLSLSERAEQYVMMLPDLPAKGAERLLFFQDYLEDTDTTLAIDAYDEFARAPYADVKALKGRMHYNTIIDGIKAEDVVANRRRLYLMMLSVCGSKQDLPMLESMMGAKERQQKAGLDAMIACYLTLKGPSGMPLVEDLFFKDKKAEYADTYAAIMALRFQVTDGKVIPKERVVEAFRYMLDRPDLADLVIPDLTKLEDWSVVDRLVTLFKEADEKSSWVRIPIINFLRKCPLDGSKELIEELRAIDSESVRKSFQFYPESSLQSGGEVAD